MSNKASYSHSEGVQTHWATVLLQPLPGSGERIVVAVAAVSDNGERRCLRTIDPAHAKVIFRDEHRYVSDLITFVTDSLDAHLAHAQSLDNWVPPLEGVALGVQQQGNASDIDDFVRGAASLSTIFYSDQPQPRDDFHPTRPPSCRGPSTPPRGDAIDDAGLKAASTSSSACEPDARGFRTSALCARRIGYTGAMQELSMSERVRRLVDAGRRDSAVRPAGEDGGELLYRLCLGCSQVLDARPDGDAVRHQQEPPAPDYRDIWTRLNRQWRERNA